MAAIALRNSKVLSDFGVPYIVAEMNTSHFGNMDLAKQMIATSKDVGCDCVKFQSWSADTLYSKSYYENNTIAKRMVSKFSLSENDLLETAYFARECNIDFSSTPYAREEVDFLVEKCDVPFIKIASMELNNHPYLEYVASTGVPIVLSTGMGDIEEIRQAVKVIERANNTNICLLHCISIYPADVRTINLNNICGLREEFPDYPIGFSDHSLGTEISAAAIALGACLIEKHFTLDKSRIGMDNQMACEPGEMLELVRGCQNVQMALGSSQRIVYPAEIEQRTKMRRSIVSARKMAAGTVLTESDLHAIRPGTGLPPDRMHSLIGRTLVRDVDIHTMIEWSFLA